MEGWHITYLRSSTYIFRIDVYGMHTKILTTYLKEKIEIGMPSLQDTLVEDRISLMSTLYTQYLRAPGLNYKKNSRYFSGIAL